MQTEIFSMPLAVSFSGASKRRLSPQRRAITQEELVRRTQELFDAVVPGNPEPWKKHYAEDAMFSDEKGRSLNKTSLVADITPMPKGYSGTIKIVRPQSRISATLPFLVTIWTKRKRSSVKISKRVITKPTPGCDAMASGRLSPHKHFVITKILRLGKRIRKSSRNFRRHLRISTRQYENRYCDGR